MRLKVVYADGAVKTVPLDGKCPMVIGRSEGAGLCIADKKVSRRHAEIRTEGGEFFLEDLSSRTGTRVNGKLIEGETKLSVGDTVQIGETELILEKTEPAAPAPAPARSVPAGGDTRNGSAGHRLPLYSAQSALVSLYSETMIRLARRIQNRVLELLNIGNSSAREMTNSEMRPKVEGAVEQILREEGCGTVGTALRVRHLSATPVGMEVTARTELYEIDGRRLVFKVEVRDAKGMVGDGEHERFIVKNESFLRKAKGKLE